MTTRAIDNNGDWVFGNGILDYVSDLEEIKQNIITTLRSWKGDCFFDIDAGVDWYNYIGSFGRDNDLKKDIIKNICSVDGVINVEKYDAYLNSENRKITIQVMVNTIYGNLEIKQEM